MTVAAVAAPPAGRRATRRSAAPLWLLGPPLLAVGLGVLVPLVSLLSRSMSDKGVSGSLDTLRQPLFLETVSRTLLLAVVVSALCVVLGVGYAMALAAAGPKSRLLLWGALGVTFWISLLVRTYGWVLLLQPNGVLDKALMGLHVTHGPINALQTTPAMYPGMVHIMLPYMILPIYASLSALEASQLRAARSLGGRPWLTFRKVVLPQIAPGAIAGSIVVFVLSIGFFVTPAFLGGPNKLTVGTIIEREFNGQFDFGAASVMSLALVAVVLVVYLLADRWFKVGEHWTAV